MSATTETTPTTVTTRVDGPALLAAARTAAAVLGRRPRVVTSLTEGVRVLGSSTGVTLYASNFATSVLVEVAGEDASGLDVLVSDARAFVAAAEAVSAFARVDLSVSADGESLFLTAGAALAEVTLATDEARASAPRPHAVTSPTPVLVTTVGDLATSVKRVMRTIEKTREANPVLRGALLRARAGRATLRSTDRYRLTDETVAGTVVVPDVEVVIESPATLGRLLATLPSGADVTLHTAGGFLYLHDYASSTTLGLSLVPGTYPALDTILRAGSGSSASVGRVELDAALTAAHRAGVEVVDLAVENGSLVLTDTDPDSGFRTAVATVGAADLSERRFSVSVLRAFDLTGPRRGPAVTVTLSGTTGVRPTFLERSDLPGYRFVGMPHRR